MAKVWCTRAAVQELDGVPAALAQRSGRRHSADPERRPSGLPAAACRGRGHVPREMTPRPHEGGFWQLSGVTITIKPGAALAALMQQGSAVCRPSLGSVQEAWFGLGMVLCPQQLFALCTIRCYMPQRRGPLWRPSHAAASSPQVFGASRSTQRSYCTRLIKQTLGILCLYCTAHIVPFSTM